MQKNHKQHYFFGWYYFSYNEGTCQPSGGIYQLWKNIPTKGEYTNEGKEYTSQGEEYTTQGEEYTSQGEEYTHQGEEYTSQEEEYTIQGEEYTSQRKKYTSYGEWRKAWRLYWYLPTSSRHSNSPSPISSPNCFSHLILDFSIDQKTRRDPVPDLLYRPEGVARSQGRPAVGLGQRAATQSSLNSLLPAPGQQFLSLTINIYISPSKATRVNIILQIYMGAILSFWLRRTINFCYLFERENRTYCTIATMFSQ